MIISDNILLFPGQNTVHHEFFFIINSLGYQPTAMQFYKPITPQTLGLAVVAIHCIQSINYTRMNIAMQFSDNQYQG